MPNFKYYTRAKGGKLRNTKTWPTGKVGWPVVVAWVGTYVEEYEHPEGCKYFAGAFEGFPDGTFQRTVKDFVCFEHAEYFAESQAAGILQREKERGMNLEV